MKKITKLILISVVMTAMLSSCVIEEITTSEEQAWEDYLLYYQPLNPSDNGNNGDNNGGNTSTTIPSNMQGTWYVSDTEYYFYDDSIEMYSSGWYKMFDVISCDSDNRSISLRDPGNNTYIYQYTLSADSLTFYENGEQAVAFTRTISNNNNNGDSNDSGDNNNGNNDDNNSENTTTTIPSNMQGTWYTSYGSGSNDAEFYFYNDKIELRSGDIRQKLYDITNCDSQSITFLDPIYIDSIWYDETEHIYAYTLYDGDSTLCLSNNERDINIYFYREIQNNNSNDEYTPYTNAGVPENMLYQWIEVGTGFLIYIDGDTIHKTFPNAEYNEFIQYEVISCDSTSLTFRDRDNNDDEYYCSYTISGNTMIWSGDISMSCIRSIPFF